MATKFFITPLEKFVLFVALVGAGLMIASILIQTSVMIEN